MWRQTRAHQIVGANACVVKKIEGGPKCIGVSSCWLPQYSARVVPHSESITAISTGPPTPMRLCFLCAQLASYSKASPTRRPILLGASS